MDTVRETVFESWESFEGNVMVP